MTSHLFCSSSHSYHTPIQHLSCHHRTNCWFHPIQTHLTRAATKMVMRSLIICLSIWTGLQHVAHSFVVTPRGLQARRLPATDTKDEEQLIVESDEDDVGRRNLIINTVAAGLTVTTGIATWDLYKLEVYTPSGFRRLPTTQFLAALGPTSASSGKGAGQWGVWKEDPGPRGVWLRSYQQDLVQNDNIAPRGWKFDPQDFWIEEHGAYGREKGRTCLVIVCCTFSDIHIWLCPLSFE